VSIIIRNSFVSQGLGGRSQERDIMLLVGFVGATTGLVLLQQHNMRQQYREMEKRAPAVQQAAKAASNLQMHTGIYGDISQVIHLLQEPGMIVYEEPDTDLSGMPFRWLHLKTGGIYRCYDTKNPKVFVPK